MRYVVLTLCILTAVTARSAPPPTPAPKVVEDDLPRPDRALTDGEVALLQPIFGDGIEYAHVRVIDASFPLQPAGGYMTPRGQLYAPGPLWQPDFSTVDADLRAVFVHEMTHVWQFANGMDLVIQGVVDYTRSGGNYKRTYAYELVAGRDLTDYRMEQQAAIVEDYYRTAIEHDEPQQLTNLVSQGPALPDRAAPPKGGAKDLSTSERDALYAAVLKNLLGNPRYARPTVVVRRQGAAK
jgi:hypothetical protein